MDKLSAIKKRMDEFNQAPKDERAFTAYANWAHWMSDMRWLVDELSAQQPAPDTGATDQPTDDQLPNTATGIDGSDYEWVIDTHDGRGNWQRKEADDGC